MGKEQITNYTPFLLQVFYEQYMNFHSTYFHVIYSPFIDSILLEKQLGIIQVGMLELIENHDIKDRADLRKLGIKLI